MQKDWLFGLVSTHSVGLGRRSSSWMDRTPTSEHCSAALTLISTLVSSCENNIVGVVLTSLWPQMLQSRQHYPHLKYHRTCSLAAPLMQSWRPLDAVLTPPCPCVNLPLEPSTGISRNETVIISKITPPDFHNTKRLVPRCLERNNNRTISCARQASIPDTDLPSLLLKLFSKLYTRALYGDWTQHVRVCC